ncbi:hypothetical protein D3C71_276790 [compost metagenome]
MKLVELLAKEMDKWPEGCTCGYCVQANESTEVFFGGPARSIFLSAMADDHEDARVTTEQWQAERDRQKGGEWKRHRGGVQPVPDGDRYVEVKLRSGDIQQARADAFIWTHKQCDVSANIMQYRIISQPQSEEVDVSTFCKGENCNATAENIVHSLECEAEHEASHTGTWCQSLGPLAWRDTIVHCQAIIEDCEREIAKNENLLALEGFALIPAMTPVAGVADVDMGDWRNWAKGDIVEVILPNDSGLSVGKQYTIQRVEDPEYIFGIPVNVIDEEGNDHWPEDDEGEGRLVFKFIRRP